MAVATETLAQEGARRRLVDALFSRTDIAVLVYFRVIFGVVMAWDGVHAFQEHRVDQLVHANVLFNYWPFTFVKLLPASLLDGAYGLLIVAGVFMAVGLYYRASAIVIFVCQAYFFLLDAGLYLNHMYLVCLIAFLMIFMPANRRWSLDTRFDASLRRDHVPAWTVWLLMFQIGIPYFFGGLAKLNADYFRGAPLRTFLLTQRDFPLIGRFFDNHLAVTFFIFGALLLDLLVVFFLLNRRTRVFAYAAALAFHLVNSRIFNIGIFPWLMIGATAVYFPPDWPRRLVNEARTKPRSRRFWRFVVGFVVVGALASYIPTTYSIVHTLVGGLGGGLVGYFIDDIWRRERVTAAAAAAAAPDSVPQPDAALRPNGSSRRRVVVGLLAAWVGFQVLFPLRHLLLPGNVLWTEESQRFSWYMMLNNKTGKTIFLVRDPRTGKTVEVDPADVLADFQLDRMTGSPDLTVQFAHYLRDRARKDLHIANAEVRVRTMISLNFRPEQVFIDPNVDLSRVKRPWFGHKEWILPLAPRPHGPQGPKQLEKNAGGSAG